MVFEAKKFVAFSAMFVFSFNCLAFIFGPLIYITHEGNDGNNALREQTSDRYLLDFGVDKPNRPFVGLRIGISDRFGNRLFSLASLIGIATKNNLNVRNLDNFEEIFKTLKINATFKMLSLKDGEKYVEFKKAFKTYDNTTDMLKFSSDNHRLTGYYNCFRYFYHVADDIRHGFQPNAEVDQRLTEFLEARKPTKDFVRIGIHIRRGDFVTSHFGETVASEQYFNHAMEYMKLRFGGKHIQYIIISDDMEYSRKTINATDVIFSNFKEPLEDMALMAKADHAIITTGTFSWWCGFLTGGVVVYYKNYPAKGSTLDKAFSAQDFFPPEWIALD